ncbi:NAD-dependent epimerase/dehydratase family protein [Variovorax saccharolyticus]|uniref:NAD-dependent epimerase/dehydratase family protein n=1 Tax=Variovorax saccharolyticus TaxID=3053516 RepID=UPI002574A94C|nr:NAD(P)-dependent oxidoreductase [Variovorax sp. J31P216]MDM0029435.1 NAD(P)-dependent oxidoreductase [Variovorax sp. J31P216]
MKVALLGGSGFVGTRLLEKWLLSGSHDVRVVVRSPGSLARMARFALPEWEQADVFDAASLSRAIEGCDTMVHAIVGDADQIATAAQAALEACRSAGVRRLVYLSSASVHGQNPPPGTNDLSPLRDDQPAEYNNAKVRAERLLRDASGVEVCILRPGIVYGPRSQWFSGLPRALRSRQAFLVEGGQGICNHIYVDNLVHAIELGLVHPRATEGPFYVADDAALSWREFYRPVVQALGFDVSDFQVVPAAPPRPPTLRDRVMRVNRGRASQLLMPMFSRRLKDAVKAGLDRYSAAAVPNGFVLPQPGAPAADWEISQLHTCATRLPMDRAVEILGYAPPLGTTEALDRSARWLAGMWGTAAPADPTASTDGRTARA